MSSRGSIKLFIGLVISTVDMGRKKKSGGTIKCRYECGEVFGSQNGRASHERRVHGNIFPKRDIEQNDTAPLSTPKTPAEDDAPPGAPLSEEQNFIKVSDVKFTMAKKKQEPKGKDDEFESECGACGHEYNGDAKFCPACGVEFA